MVLVLVLEVEIFDFLGGDSLVLSWEQSLCPFG